MNIVQCHYCRQDTAGNHEANCPMAKSYNITTTTMPVGCPDCARLKVLLLEANVLLDSYADVLGKGKLYDKFMLSLKKEGIE